MLKCCDNKLPELMNFEANVNNPLISEQEDESIVLGRESV